MKGRKYIKRTKSLYSVCIIAMILLVIAALFLPQIIFSIQDKYRMMNTEAKTRNSLDIAQLDLDYEQQLNERLNNFFGMSDTTVTAIDYEFEDSEWENLVESIFYQEWFIVLINNSLVTDYIYAAQFWDMYTVNIQDSKKYIVYGKDYRDGIALMMWYLDIYMESPGIRIRLLVDTESNTIYYVKITSDEKTDSIATDGVIDKEYFYYLAEIIAKHYDFYYNYYEADEQYNEVEETRGIKSEVDDNILEVIFNLPYEHLNAEFLFRTEYKNGNYPDITVGFPAIGKKIPEIMQN